MPIHEPRSRKSPARGFTIAEMLVAMGLSLSVGLILTLSWQMVKQVQFGEDSRSSARQKIRNALEEISDTIRRGQYVYAGFSGVVDGHAYTVPATGGSGSDLLYAVPLNNGTSTPYVIYGVYARNRVPFDPRSPNAQQIVLYQKTGVTPPRAGVPASIVLTGLSGGSVKVFDAYLLPPDGMRFTVSPTASSVSVDTQFQVDPISAPSHSEEFKTQWALRNR